MKFEWQARNLRRGIRVQQLLTTALLVLLAHTTESLALSSTSSRSPLSLKARLQKCYTPTDVLNFVTQVDLTRNNDPTGEISSHCLVRLSKQLIHLDNQQRHEGMTDAWKSTLTINCEPWRKLSTNLEQVIQAIDCNSANLVDASAFVDYHVEGIKSMSVLVRILPAIGTLWVPFLERLQDQTHRIVQVGLEPYQLSGLYWALEALTRHCFGDCRVPVSVRHAHDELGLPFRVRPGCMASIPDFTLENLISQVNYQVDAIQTSSNLVVQERRKTAWEGDDGVAPFAYSGKSMVRNPWSPLVKASRDRLMDVSGIYYDGCLLNLYPDGGSGMRYHSDPDQGVLWDYETAVVSLGATRRFSFRHNTASMEGASSSSSQQQQRPHTFVLMHGDVVEMFGDCQSKFQHTVRTADEKNEEAARASLVFKRTLS
ncbi:hypothetical protein MHU86_18298 [Fragilaria crotonensis]|nr:hypothetical protein MHU86_18298 [Fragilaria crotonensis]